MSFSHVHSTGTLEFMTSSQPFQELKASTQEDSDSDHSQGEEIFTEHLELTHVGDGAEASVASP